VTRPALLFYCQHSLGLGHLVRSYALARELAQFFAVTLIRGGEEPAGIAPPDDVTIVQLPAVTADVDGGLHSSSQDVGEVIERRRLLLLEAVANESPAAVVVELFPFGRKKLAPELLPLLETARTAGARVICSVRDLLVDRGERQLDHDERASVILNELFDAVLVHADPDFARLEESFRPRTPLQVPVHYTGFVVPERVDAETERARHVVVSAGGGAYGEELLVNAIRARPLLAADMDVRIIGGPFALDDAWARLRAAAAEVGRGVELVRHVPDLEVELATASASVSQCGYNTALALVRSRIPALVVPFGAAQENEQPRRAERLAELGLVRVLDAEALTPETLARELDSLRGFRPAEVALDLGGAARSAEIVRGLVGTAPSRQSRRGDWLAPVRRALATRTTPLDLFCRDDDAGWETAGLLGLLDVFAACEAPLDLAVIPAALDEDLAAELLRRAGASTLRLHQHGFAHVNHETTGRKSEFGPSRSAAEQRDDLAAGRSRLQDLVGPLVDPIFTPPWNRCTETTAECLAELGFTILSRESRAKPIASAVRELPVAINWLGRGRKRRTRLDSVLQAAIALGGPSPVGLMLHHADLDGDGLRDTAALLGFLAGAAEVAIRPMVECGDSYDLAGAGKRSKVDAPPYQS